MGGAYIEIDLALAKFYFEKALTSLDKLDDFSDSTKEVLRANILELIEKIN